MLSRLVTFFWVNFTKKLRCCFTLSDIEYICLIWPSISAPDTGSISSFIFFTSAKNAESRSVAAKALRKVSSRSFFVHRFRPCFLGRFCFSQIFHFCPTTCGLCPGRRTASFLFTADEIDKISFTEPSTSSPVTFSMTSLLFRASVRN